uniref:Cadherin domain-containing protein n=1 Tax=Chelonoidis abingdonii TaxID=106734 RepID=A0A8C0QL70_CHEAB
MGQRFGITLLDVNDNTPVVSGSYNIFVNEEQENISIQIQAFDNDEPGTNNSRLRFQLEPGAFSTNFTIDSATGVLHSLGVLDREAIEPALQGKVVVTVWVHDLGVPQLSSLVNVTIIVEDVNDNTPFQRQGRAPLTGFPSPGAFVGSVEAEDADQTEVHHRISFQLVSGSGSSSFLLRSIRLGPGQYQGNLSLDPDVALDYDRLSPAYFNLTVQAENTGTGDALNVVPTTVQVLVLDVNDEPPTLVPASLQDVSVAEDAQPGLLTTLQASDLDTNHLLHFQELGLACYKGAGAAGHVCQDWFYLEPNGSVFLNSSQIDYEVCDLATITLRVEDTRTEEGNRYSNNATLRILISDVNDNSPEFLRINDTFGETWGHDMPGLLSQARDADSGPRGAITFSISKVLFLQDNGPSHTLTSVFKVATTAEGDLYIGSIHEQLKTISFISSTLGTAPCPHLAWLTLWLSLLPLQIFTVDQSYRVRLVFSTSVNEVQENSDKIKALSPGPAPASTALGATPVAHPPTVCFCSYRRKLKAMKALKVASTLTASVAQQGPAIPGTNKYNAEGANPILNLTLDAPSDLGFDEDSNADAARWDWNVSLGGWVVVPRPSRGPAWGPALCPRCPLSPAGGRSDWTGTAQPSSTLANLCCSLSCSLNSLDENMVENLAEGSPGPPVLQVSEQPLRPRLPWRAWPAWQRALPRGSALPCSGHALPLPPPRAVSAMGTGHGSSLALVPTLWPGLAAPSL